VIITGVTVVTLAGLRVGRVLPMMPHRHAKAGADRREALHRHGERDDEDEQKALEAVGHVLKLYYRRMETVELKVEGMDCQGCVKSVTRMLSGVAGVDKVDVSLEEGRARVTYDPAKAAVADMKRAVERAGYKAP
jgi:copper chaperone